MLALHKNTARSSFSCLPLAQGEKRCMLPRHTLGPLLFMHGLGLVMDTRPETCITWTQTCVGTTRHIFIGQIGNQGKKEADSSTLVLPAIRTLCRFTVFGTISTTDAWHKIIHQSSSWKNGKKKLMIFVKIGENWTPNLWRTVYCHPNHWGLLQIHNRRCALHTNSSNIENLKQTNLVF